MTTAAFASDSDADGARLSSEALLQGRALLTRWTLDGTLVAASALRTRWRSSRQAIEAASRAGQLFGVKVSREYWYPAVFLDLTPSDVSAISMVLKGCSSESRLVFWLRKHGGLGGMTVAQTLQAGRLRRAVEVASAWADENGKLAEFR